MFMPATKYLLLFLLIPSSWLKKGLTFLHMLPPVGWKKNCTFSDCPKIVAQASVINRLLTHPTFIEPLLRTRPSARS